ncbi:HNH endonuclease signature motif containing protein [Moritella sp.]|uniref:HNH endonuclease n=1 Tax=Moritella sp. TaxID=78556 RepID=UPI0025E8D1E6|nr:HNH endonuclease signature motif containing protein [Moritella sp.]MCJ8351388.1 HNH endonuclease [Moritella sp.]
MKQLTEPKYTFKDVLNSCAEGMKQKNIKSAFQKNIPHVVTMGHRYKELGSKGCLFSYPKTKNITKNTIVVGELTKKKLVNLYVLNLRNKEKPARKLYEKLMASTDEKCPFCGDIGVPKNLDHFLPLAHFPQFSVMPINLIPACRDCNMGEKGDAFAIQADKQILHPYLDKNILFNEQWVYARFVKKGDGAIEYFVNPPEEWNPIDKKRVNQHFDDFDLAFRYRIEAGKHLSELIAQRDAFYITMKMYVPIEDFPKVFIDTILTPVINGNSFINQWKRIMYIALSKSNDFLIPK